MPNLRRQDCINYLLGLFRRLYLVIDTVYGHFPVVSRDDSLSYFYTWFTTKIDEILEESSFPELEDLYKKPWPTLFTPIVTGKKEWEGGKKEQFEYLLSEIEKLDIQEGLGTGEDTFDFAHIYQSCPSALPEDLREVAEIQDIRNDIDSRLKLAIEDYARRMDEFIYGKEHKGTYIYKGVYSDFDRGRIWIEKGEEFVMRRSSDIFRMWRLLLMNEGIVVSYREIAHALGWSEEWGKLPNSCESKIKKTKENLVTRLVKLGIHRDQVASWFLTSNGFGLEKSEGIK